MHPSSRVGPHWRFFGARRAVLIGFVIVTALGGCDAAKGAGTGQGSHATPTAPRTATPTEPPPPAVPHPFGLLSCAPRDGIRLCQGGQQGGKDLRVRSFDGVPLDADLALPATGTGPFPLIVMMHGLGGSKTSYENSTDDHGVDDTTFASMGYAVLMYTARGFGDSCGTPASRAGTPACAKGWQRLADQRYEIRDTQYLAGLLVDEDLVKPAIAVTGISYGGGQSLELAMMKNRERLPNGALVPWVSPRRKIPMSVAVAYAQWPWDDLVTSLTPNGDLLTGSYTAPNADTHPYGVEKQSWNRLLYGVAASYYLAPPGADPGADLTNWYKVSSKGEPYPASAEAAVKELQTYHSAIGIPMPAGGPAAVILQNGWTDTLFPVSEALHFATRLAPSDVKSPLYEIFDDVGHGWAQGKGADVARGTAKAISFLNTVMLSHATPPSGVLAIGTTCPSSRPSGPVLTGSSWKSLFTGSLSFRSSSTQVVTSTGGDPATATALNPAYAGKPFCDLLPAAREAGTAVYGTTVSRATVLLGGLVVSAHLRVVGDFPELVGRLWDLNPATGTRQLIEAGDLRPAVNQSASDTTATVGTTEVTFELAPNEYTVPAGDRVELELVGSTAPWFRPSNGSFRITVNAVTASIPTG